MRRRRLSYKRQAQLDFPLDKRENSRIEAKNKHRFMSLFLNLSTLYRQCTQQLSSSEREKVKKTETF